MAEYYMNKREVRAEDFTLVNPDIEDPRDKNGNLLFNLTRLKSYKQLQTKPAFYVLSFSNGYFYAGSTKNVLNRITQHYNAFESLKSQDWHRVVGTLIRKKKSEELRLRDKHFKYVFCVCVTILVQYTSSKSIAEQLEKEWLQDMVARNFANMCYNTVLYTGKKNNLKLNSSENNSLKSIARANDDYFKGVKVLNNIEQINFEADIELKKTIDEKVNRMANEGRISISISSLDYFKDFVAINPKEELRQFLFQLAANNEQDCFSEDAKFLRAKNCGPIPLNKITCIITPDKEYSTHAFNLIEIEKIRKEIPREGGVYILEFPNGKKYIGSSKNLNQRILIHLRKIFIGPPQVKWHEKSKIELGKHTIKDVKISYIVTENYREKEDELIRKEKMDMLYNTQVGFEKIREKRSVRHV